MNGVPWNEILSRIDKLGLSLTDTAKQGIEFLWPLAYRQAIVSGITGVVGGLILMFLAMVGVKFAVASRDKKEEDFILDKNAGKIILIWLLSFIALVIGVISLVASINTLANPDWYAIQNIIDLITQK